MSAHTPTRRDFIIAALSASAGAGATWLGMCRENLEPVVRVAEQKLYFTPCIAPITVEHPLAQNFKIAMQREVIVTTGDELLLTGALSTCDAVYLIAPKSGIRSVAHLDTIHDNKPIINARNTRQEIDQQVKMFYPGVPIYAAIKLGNWEIEREAMFMRGQVPPQVININYTQDLKGWIIQALAPYGNISIVNISVISAHNSAGNACGIDKDGRLYETFDIKFPFNQSKERIAAKSARVKSGVTELRVEFDGRSELQKREIDEAWAKNNSPGR